MKKMMRKYLYLMLAACLLMVPVSAMAAPEEDAKIETALETEEALDAAAEPEETTAPEEEKVMSDGIHKSGGKRYYYKDNEMQYGLQKVKIDGVTYIYYFGEDGAALTGYQEIDGKAYYFSYSGRAYTKGYLEYTLDGKKCRSYFNKSGEKVTNAFKVVKTRYMADDQDIFKSIGDGTYYRYYFDENGMAFTGGLLKYTDGGVIYRSYFGSDGNAYTKGYKKVSKLSEVVDGKIQDVSDGQVHRYYFRTIGKAYTKGFLQFVHSDGKTYRYYFRSNGDALLGSFHSAKTRYSADAEGNLKDISDGKTYYYYFKDAGNAFNQGFLKYTDDGKTRYSWFQSNGQAYVGYRSVATKYAADKNGAVTKSDDTATKKYYFTSTGKAYTGGFLKFVHTDGKTYNYYFQEDGSAYTKGLKALSIRHAADVNGKVTSISDGKTYRYYFQTVGNAYSKGFLTFIHTTGTKYNMYFQTDGTAFTDGSKSVKTRTSADKNGVMTDITDENNYLYTFNSKGYGTLTSGRWAKSGDNWVYYDAKGVSQFTSNRMHDAWLKIKDKSSGTQYYSVVNTKACETYTFKGSSGKWVPFKKWSCSPGKPSTPTVKGTFSVYGRGYSFGTSSYTCYYYTQFYGNYLFHSTLFYAGTFKNKDARLGQQLSHGCVRLSLENAKWYYNNLGNGTKVLIY